MLRRKGKGNGQQGIHLVVLLEDLLVLVGASVVPLRARDVGEDPAEGADGVRVPPEGEVGEANVVEEGDLAGSHAREQGAPRLGHVDRLENLQGQVVIADKAVHTEQADEAEVAEVVVESAVSETALILLILKPLDDATLGNEEVEVLENGDDVPSVGVVLELLDLLGLLVLELAARLAEALELVDELVHHVPEPLVGQLEVERCLALEETIEERTVVLEGVEPLLQRRLELRVDVPEVHLLVQKHERLVSVNDGRDGVEWRPGAVLEEPVGELVEAALVHGVHILHLAGLHAAVEVLDEVLHNIGQLVGPGLCVVL
mmetsp:Transcript_15764/g.61588  ORF Transcript_15764/g.61588 Transcript_15764/m.61588 type:complete len:317 (-) Transcript_15764:65-1015(-)